jgi:hypothetical protein
MFRSMQLDRSFLQRYDNDVAVNITSLQFDLKFPLH